MCRCGYRESDNQFITKGAFWAQGHVLAVDASVNMQDRGTNSNNSKTK